MGWRSVNFHTHISLVNKYVYVEVPKAGCGTTLAAMTTPESRIVSMNKQISPSAWSMLPIYGYLTQWPVTTLN
jgi:hypothetical protein